jgi:hypothetical protein
MFRSILLTSGTVVVEIVAKSRLLLRTDALALGITLGCKMLLYYVLSAAEISNGGRALIDTRRYFHLYSCVIADVFSQYSACNDVTGSSCISSGG